MFPIVGAAVRLLSVNEFAEHCIVLLRIAAKVYGKLLAPHTDGYMSALLTHLQKLAPTDADASKKIVARRMPAGQHARGRAFVCMEEIVSVFFRFSRVVVCSPC